MYAPITKDDNGFQSTPLMRGETIHTAIMGLKSGISIHSPHARGDVQVRKLDQPRTKFQSTPLMRGETKSQVTFFRASIFQSTPLMRGETVDLPNDVLHIQHFNPLPSCEGRLLRAATEAGVLQFQSTPLMRGETPRKFAGDDRLKFQSTPLMRGETSFARLCSSCEIFQSTPLMRGETDTDVKHARRSIISIHSPHARGDWH